jgi:hypothetical protein
MIFSESTRKNRLSIAVQALNLFVPLIALLPLSSDSYGLVETNWCSYTNAPAGVRWNIGLLLVSLCINGVAIIINCSVIARLLKNDPGNYRTVLKVVRGSTLYCFVTVGCWIPKMFTFNSGEFDVEGVGIQTARFFTFLACFCYFVIYVLERETMIAFEAYVQEAPKDSITQSITESDVDSNSFSFSSPQQSTDAAVTAQNFRKEFSLNPIH